MSNDRKGYPNYLYKYKALNTKTDLKRVIEIVKNRSIYVPTREQLNDPFEGVAIPEINFCVAGQWYYQAQHKNHRFLDDYLNKYRILSLSSVCDSPQMWAHYAGNYSGVCIEFSTQGVFGNSKPLAYIQKKPSGVLLDPDPEEILELIEKSYFLKGYSWNYENEYRILKNEADKYLLFDKNDIKSIILGHRVNDRYKNKIIQVCSQYNIPVYSTNISDMDYKIYIIDIAYIEEHKAGSGENISGHIKSYRNHK